MLFAHYKGQSSNQFQSVLYRPSTVRVPPNPPALPHALARPPVLPHALPKLAAVPYAPAKQASLPYASAKQAA